MLERLQRVPAAQTKIYAHQVIAQNTKRFHGTKVKNISEYNILCYKSSACVKMIMSKSMYGMYRCLFSTILHLFIYFVQMNDITTLQVGIHLS